LIPSGTCSLTLAALYTLVFPIKKAIVIEITNWPKVSCIVYPRHLNQILDKNAAGYDSADAWFGSAGLNYIPGHFGEESQRYFGLGLYVTEVRIGGWDTRDNTIVTNASGKWLDLDPTVYFTPDGGKFTASFSVAHPFYIKVHSLQTTQSLSNSFGLAYRF
jgi:hypothetical protein